MFINIIIQITIIMRKLSYQINLKQFLEIKADIVPILFTEHQFKLIEKKFTNKKIPLEQRKLNEVWDNAPNNVKIKNPAFEFIPKKNITKIVCEFGMFSYSDFVKKMKTKKN